MKTTSKRTDLLKNLPEKSVELGLQGEVPTRIAELWKNSFTEYSFEGVAGDGKTGIAYKIRHSKTLVNYCLKMAKPEITETKVIEAVRESLKKEVDILLPVKHQCLPTIIKYDTTGEIPYYVCTFHPGKTFDAFMRAGSQLDVNQSYFVISLLLSVLDYLHQAGRPHCDIHTKNLMIDEDVFRFGLLLIDFGSGHRESDPSPLTKNAGLPFVKDTEGKGSFQQTVRRVDANASFKHADFRALGCLLATMSSHFFVDGSAAQCNAYHSFCHDLEHGSINSWHIAKERLLAVIDPLRKVSLIDRLFFDDKGRRSSIPLPVSHSVSVGEASLAIINTVAFQRLRTISQLSFCEWRFPGASHTRFEHSLGVFHLVHNALDHLCQDNRFRDAYSLEELKGCLLAGLLHDIGHYPLAHVIEQYAAGGRLKDDPTIRTDVAHISHSKFLIENDLELKKAILRYWGDEALANCIEILEGKHGALSSLLDGALDCDKMDYLVRDAFHCGLEFGRGLDVSNILRNIRLTDDRKQIAIVEGAVTGVEGLMVLQNQMLASVYWHPTVRAIVCMAHAAMAHITKSRGGDHLRNIVIELKKCHSNREGVERVILPELDKLGKRPFARLSKLVRLHMEPRYTDIFKPIRTYRSSDERLPSETTTIFNSINHIKTSASSASTQPVDWDNVSKLRKAFIAAFKEKGIEVETSEIIIDVPLGKTSHRTIPVIRDDGSECDIVEVSHLNRTVFEEPTIFVSPIRVFIAPHVRESAVHNLLSIIQSAEEQFHHPSGSTISLVSGKLVV
jgi:HD superfamily phosphohydrolase